MNGFLQLVTTLIFLRDISAQDVYETVDAAVGQSAQLPCNTTAESEGDKLTVLAWYRDEAPIAFYSRDLRKENGEGEAPKGRYQMKMSDYGDNLVIDSVRPADAGNYHCHAHFAGSPGQKTHLKLNVIEPPQRMWVLYENGKRVAVVNVSSNVSKEIGPYYVGDTVRLICVAFGGKPLASLSWWSDEKMLKNASTKLSEMRVRSDLAYGTLVRADLGRVLSCRGSNHERSPTLAIDIVIDMHLSPDLVSVVGVGEWAQAGGRMREGAALALQCRVLGARPPPPVEWRRNDAPLYNLQQNVTTDAFQQLLVSQVELTIDRSYDESIIKCCTPSYGPGLKRYICAEGLPLTVFYKPSLEITVDGQPNPGNTLAVIKGYNVTLNCTVIANPTVFQLYWFHKDTMLSEVDSVQSVLEPTLSLHAVHDAHAGDYACSAVNDEGTAYSEPLVIDVIYPPYCEDESPMEYGIAENEFVNLTCNVRANPKPSKYIWEVRHEINGSSVRDMAGTNLTETDEATFTYQRPAGCNYSAVFCWGWNEVVARAPELPNTPCRFLVTDETPPRPPHSCVALKSDTHDISVSCKKGHDGGLEQKFKFFVRSPANESLVSIVSVEPQFLIQEPQIENYKFLILAYNSKGESAVLEIDKESIRDDTGPKEPLSTVTNITTLALSLCGGVLLVALAACGLVLCAHERPPASPRAPRETLCAYNTEEFNCDTWQDCDAGSDCNLRTNSFKRAVAHPKGHDVKRTSSFHSTRCLYDEQQPHRNDRIRNVPYCRVHSLQNISKKREDALSDNLVMHFPPEDSYSLPKPMNTFYTMPRKMRTSAREASDETLESTHTSDGFSLPPPPDEFGTYRAASRIRDLPKSTATYSTISKKKPPNKDHNQFSNVIISPLNTVGLPTISGQVYNYPHDNEYQDLETTPGIQTTFQTHSSCKESGI